MNEQILEDFVLDRISSDDFVVTVFASQNFKVGDFPITRAHLLKVLTLVEKKQISAAQIEDIADYLMTSDYFSWDAQSNEGEVVDNMLADFSGHSMGFPINEMNVKLWRHYLTTGEYNLFDHNVWSAHINRQKAICANTGVTWTPINPKLKIGMGGDLTTFPINGLRHPREKGTTGWFIWAGEYSDDADFFKPMHANHLLEINPTVIRYLGLPPGYRFLFDNRGYEDIWEDIHLLNL